MPHLSAQRKCHKKLALLERAQAARAVVQDAAVLVRLRRHDLKWLAVIRVRVRVDLSVAADRAAQVVASVADLLRERVVAHLKRVADRHSTTRLRRC